MRLEGRLSAAGRGAEGSRIGAGQGHCDGDGDHRLDDVSGEKNEALQRRLGHRQAGDERLDRDAKRVDRDDAADNNAEAGAQPGEAAAGVHDGADHEGANDPPEQVAGRGAEEHTDAATAAREQGQAKGNEGEQHKHRDRTAPGAEDGASEHHAEGLCGDGYRAEYGESAGETQDGDDGGEYRDACDVGGIKAAMAGVRESRGGISDGLRRRWGASHYGLLNTVHLNSVHHYSGGMEIAGGSGSRPGRHSRDDVARAALRILDDYGLPDLTMRRLAGALSVQPSALYWHFPNKQTLLAELAERIADRARPSAAPEIEWDEAATAEAFGLRDALLAYRDGAEVVSSTFALGLGASTPLTRLRVAFERGFDSGTSTRAATALLHFILGHVSHEQLRLQYDSMGVVPASVSQIATGDREAFAFGVDLLIEGLRQLHSSAVVADTDHRPAGS